MQIKQPLLTNTATYAHHWECYLAKDESQIYKNLLVLIDSKVFILIVPIFQVKKASTFCSIQIKQILLTNTATYANYGSVI